MAKQVKKITTALGRFSNSTVTNDDTSYKTANVADYTVKKKVEGKYKLARTLYIIFLPIVLLAIAVLLVVLLGAAGLALCTFVILGGWFINFIFWRYLSIEYSYAIENTELIATEIYGEKSDKLLLRIKMSQVDKVQPYDAEYKAEADAISDRIVAISSWDSPDLYYAIYTKDDGSKGVFFFEAADKTLRAFKYYNGQNTIVRKMSR